MRLDPFRSVMIAAGGLIAFTVGLAAGIGVGRDHAEHDHSIIEALREEVREKTHVIHWLSTTRPQTDRVTIPLDRIHVEQH